MPKVAVAAALSWWLLLGGTALRNHREHPRQSGVESFTGVGLAHHGLLSRVDTADPRRGEPGR